MVDLHARVVPGKAVFRLIGTCSLILLLFWNPIVLRPRFWNLSAFFGSLIIDTALPVGGIGLLYLRKWAALLFLALSGHLAFVFSRGEPVAATAIFALHLILLAAFWRNLVWGNAARDSLLAFGGVVAAGLIDCIAFFIRPR
jgi:hypothetical protein